MISFEEFKARLEALLAEIATRCTEASRDPRTVKLLPVTKSHPVTAVEYVARFGLEAVGENRVQEAIEKQGLASLPVRWELIGHLQSNKAKLAARHFSRIQSVDSEKLASALSRAGEEQGKKVSILLQINAGRDPAKFGAEIEDAPRLLESALSQPHLCVEGLMTIAPLSEDTTVAERTFENLRDLRDRLSAQFATPLTELSMGMSGDFAAAILAGSTQIRVGTRLFGERATQ